MVERFSEDDEQYASKSCMKNPSIYGKVVWKLLTNQWSAIPFNEVPLNLTM